MHTHTLAYCSRIQFFFHIFQSLPDCLPLTLRTLDCYLHPKLFQNHKSKLGGAFFCFEVLPKPWKSFIPRCTHHKQTLKQRHNAVAQTGFFLEAVCVCVVLCLLLCGFMIVTGVCTLLFICSFGPISTRHTHTHTHTHTHNRTVLYPLVILWGRQKIDFTSAYKWTRITPVIPTIREMEKAGEKVEAEAGLTACEVDIRFCFLDCLCHSLVIYLIFFNVLCVCVSLSLCVFVWERESISDMDRCDGQMSGWLRRSCSVKNNMFPDVSSGRGGIILCGPRVSPAMCSCLTLYVYAG